MNVFSLFAKPFVNGERVCGPHSGDNEAWFKKNTRPLFPGAPVTKANGRSSRDRAPSICHHEREHISNRLGHQAVELPRRERVDDDGLM